MAVIVRTAGSKRTKTEIKRDYTYLTKLWNDIRTNTMKSEAPCLIHEEGSLVKRAIRDIYTNDIEEVYVEGGDSYKIAKTHMKMLIPSHAKRVFEFIGDNHLFQQYEVEEQLEQIHQNEVILKSGGYLVFNQTEALVAIDVNSGKATRERNIEETAVKTNVEAAEEIGRQLKLRDLSGLIVIDFIDMEENRNQHLVEGKLKEALRNDRARIQVGSISHFGLLEMSRQRLRPSLVESISQTCPHCEGTGRVRSVNSSALQILRILEEEISNISAKELTIITQTEIAIYILNEKRGTLTELENRAGCKISIKADATLIENEYQLLVDNIPIQTKEKLTSGKNKTERSKEPHYHPHPSNEEDIENGDQPKRKRRGRRGGRRRRRRDGDETVMSQNIDNVLETENDLDSEESSRQMTKSPPNYNLETNETQTRPKSRRRRGGKSKQNESNISSAEEISANAEAHGTAPSSEFNNESSGDKSKIKKAKKKVTPKSALSKPANEDKTKKSTRPKTKVKKSSSKKLTSKTVSKKKNSATNQKKSVSPNSSEGLAAGRKPLASIELGVTEVGDNAPAAKKRGWWTKK